MPGSYEDGFSWEEIAKAECAYSNDDLADFIVDYAPHLRAEVEELFFDKTLNDIDRRNNLNRLCDTAENFAASCKQEQEEISYWEPSLPTIFDSLSGKQIIRYSRMARFIHGLKQDFKAANPEVLRSPYRP